MLDENTGLISAATNPILPKAYESFGNDRWTPRDRTAINELAEPEPMTSAFKKELSAKKREGEKMSKVQGRKGGSDSNRESKSRKDKLKEEELDGEKVKNSRNVRDEVKGSRFMKRGKEVEKVEEKIAPEQKLKPSKSKGLSAFGTTFYKSENDSSTTPKRPSSTSDRFGRSKRSQSKDRGNDEEDMRNTSESKLNNPSKKNQSKMTENGEEARGRGKCKGGKSRSMHRIGSDSSLQDGKTVEGKKSSKAKVITAFGSTFRKAESDAVPLPKKKTSSFTDRLMRSKSSKFKEAELGEVEDSPSKLGVNHSGTKVSLSKNKLMDMVEETRKERGRGRGAYSTSTGKRARSPYQTSSEVKVNPSKVRVEGDSHGVKHQSEEKAEIVKEMSFFEKLQQNVKAYFSPKSPEMAKFEEEEKRVPEGEKRRTASFHRSKTLQKNALAEASSKFTKSIVLPMEPAQQIENVSSAYGVASAFAQVQEFHQEIKRRSWINATSVIVQEEYLTPIVNCLPGDSATNRTRWERSRTGVCRTSSRPIRKSSSKRPLRVLSCNSTADLPSSRRKIHETRSEETIAGKNYTFQSIFDQPDHGDVPRKERSTRIASKTFKLEKENFLPRRTTWIVYTLAETSLRESKFIQTPPRRESATAAETTTPESDLSRCAICEGAEESDSTEAKLTNRKTEQVPPSFTLKDIISLTRKIFDENEGRKGDSSARNERESDGEKMAKCSDSSLGYYLEKLMEEKRNYLNLQKTKNFRKAQKVNFIADSFNFFNLLNKEFLSVKTSNRSIEELRNVIAENRYPSIEKYLDMYKDVIRTSLTKPERCLIDKAKIDLEKYTDMYYDLMKYICMEKEGKTAGRSNAVSSDPLRSSKSGKAPKINYYEIFKQDGKRNVNPESDYFDKIKPKLERSVYMTKIEENRRNREFNTGNINYRTHNPRRVKAGLDSKEDKIKAVSRTEKMKEIVELLSPPKIEEPTLKIDRSEAVSVKKEQNSQGKVLLQISVCNEGLIIKQVEEPAKDDGKVTTPTTPLPSSESENSSSSEKPLSEEEKHSCTRNSVSEANLASVGTSSDEVEKTQSELLLKTESDVTIYPKSSIDEENDSSESPVEHPMLKFRAFRKLLNEGLKYLTSFSESPETDGHECPKIPKGGRVPETFEEPISYPKTTVCVREPNGNDAKKYSDEWDRGHHKSTFVKDPRQTLLRGRGSPIRTRMNEIQEEKARRLLKRNLSSFSRGVSPNKISKREPGGEGKKGTSLWWRNENAATKNSVERQRKLYRPPLRKVGINGPANRMSLLSNTLKQTASGSPGSSRQRMKGQGRKEKESANNEEGENVELEESQSDYATPTGSYLAWQFGMKNLKDLLSETPAYMLNSGGVTRGNIINEEVEEKELRETDFSCGGEGNQESTQETLSNKSNTPEMSLRLRCNNPLRTDWDQLLEASFQKDYQRVSEVLNQFMGNITEAWKAAVQLKDLIKPKSVKEPEKKEAEEPVREESNSVQGEVGKEQSGKNKAIESFRNFLRILTNVFEQNQEEASVRRELFLVMREVLESSSTSSSKAVLSELVKTGNKTAFHKEIAQIPQGLKDMLAEALLSQDKKFSRTKEDYEPGSFVTAIKNVGEKLKNLYFAEESETQKTVKEPENTVTKEAEEEPKKIYYRPSKKSFPEEASSESARIRSNLQSLAEKINRIYRERKFYAEVEGEKEEKFKRKKLVSSRSSIYFDATDRFQHSEDGQRVGFYGLPDVKPNRMPLNAIDESYFALNGKTFGKYRDLIYDKIIAFVKSDNPQNFNYGMTLLGKMMEKDDGPTSGGERTIGEDRDKKWYDLVDKLMEMCRFIESEMKDQEEKLLAIGEKEAEEKEVELARTCEYLKSYVIKMKSLMEEMKSGQQERKSTARVRALEESRETNMERQLIGRSNLTGGSLLSQNYLDSVIAFVNSIGTIGCSIDKISKNFLPNWLCGGNEEVVEPTRTDSATEEFKDSCDSVLDHNKAFVLSLKKNIDRRQKKIREMMDHAEREGIKREESLSEEKVARKVRELRKCYNLLEKMICDPTMLPPKWFKVNEESQDVEEEIFSAKRPETDFQVMTLLEDVNFRVEGSNERSLVKYSSLEEQKRKVNQQLPNELIAMFNFPIFGLKSDLPIKGQGRDEYDVVFLRPKTA